MPGPSSQRSSVAADIVEQRKELRDIVFTVWPACTEADPEHPDQPFRVSTCTRAPTKLCRCRPRTAPLWTALPVQLLLSTAVSCLAGPPCAMQAEAVIANPVAYGHEHCAEALKAPLHMVFTMPWCARPGLRSHHPAARRRDHLPSALHACSCAGRPLASSHTPWCASPERRRSAAAVNVFAGAQPYGRAPQHMAARCFPLSLMHAQARILYSLQVRLCPAWSPPGGQLSCSSDGLLASVMHTLATHL